MAVNERLQKSRNIRGTIDVKDVSPTDIYTNFLPLRLMRGLGPGNVCLEEGNVFGKS